jgi:hypothetical protein
MDYISFPISPVIAEATYWKLRPDVNTPADDEEHSLYDDYAPEDIRDKVILRNDKFKNYNIYPISALSDNTAPDLYGHEVICASNPAKLYIDLDCKNITSSTALYNTEQEFIISVIFPLLAAINDQFYTQYVIDTADTLCLHTSDDGDDFVIMSSTDISRRIFSYHILFAPTRYAFANAVIIRDFMNQVIEQLHLDGNSDIAQMIDMGVYSANHNLRTCGAAKLGDNPRVKRLLNHIYPDLFDRSPDTAFQPRKSKLRWIDTLISYVNREMTIIGNQGSNGISIAIGQSFIVMAENEYDNVLIDFVNNQLISAGHMEGFKHTSTRINPRTSENILSTVIYKKREMNQYIANVSYNLYYTRIAPSFCNICQRVHDKENSMTVYVYQNDQLCIRIYCKRNFANKYIIIRESAEDIINKCHIANIDIESRLTLLSDSPEIASDGDSVGASESGFDTHDNNEEDSNNTKEESAPKVRKTIPILKASKLNMSNKMLELLANKTGADEVKRIAEYLNRTKFTSIPNKIIYNDPIMRDLIPFDEYLELPKTLFVDAAMRLGKTKKLIELMNKYYPLSTKSGEKSKSKICILTFRQTFARHMVNQFESSGFESYDKIIGPICSNKHPRIILQIESMHRLLIRNYGQHEAPQFDVLIMDECESIFDQIDSGLSQRFGESFAVFEWLFRYSKTVIMMDAFIGDRSYNIVEHIRSLLGSVYHQNTYARSAEDKYDITCDLENWLKQLLDAVRRKKRIVITSNTKTQAEALYTMLNQIDGSIRIMIYSQDTAANVKLLHSSNVNKFWTNYDILIYTPTISAGVSFEISHYDMLFGYFVSTSCTAESAIQMMGRIRSLRDNSYKIYCSKAFISTDYYPTSTAEIESCVRRRYFSLMNTIDLSNVIIEYTIDGDILINKSNYYYIWLHNTIVKNLSRKMFMNRLIMLLLKSGAQIESLCLKSDNLTPAEITATLKECAEQNKSNKAESIALAVNLTDLEYVELKSRHDKQKMSSGYMFSEHKPTLNAEDPKFAECDGNNIDKLLDDNIAEHTAEELRDEMLNKLGMNVEDIRSDNIGDIFAIDITPQDQAAMRKHYLRSFYKLPSYDHIDTVFVTVYDTDRSRNIYKQINQLVPILPLSSKAAEILTKSYDSIADDLKSGECVDNIELCIEKIRQEESARINYAPAPANQSCIKSEDICGNSLLDHKNSKYVHLSSKHRILNQLVRFLGWKHVLDMKDKYISKAEVIRNIKDNYVNIVNLASDISSQFGRHKWLSIPVSGLDIQSLKVHLIIAPINQLLEDFYDLKIVKLEHGKIEMYNIRFVKELFIFDSIEHRYRPVYTIIPK